MFKIANEAVFIFFIKCINAAINVWVLKGLKETEGSEKKDPGPDPDPDPGRV